VLVYDLVMMLNESTVRNSLPHVICITLVAVGAETRFDCR
jgi:hypothetical protein